MPELPEVETVRLGLSPVLEGQVLTDVQMRRDDLRVPFPKNFVARTKGCKVIKLRRRAKYLLADLDTIYAPANKLANLDDAAWAKAKADMGPYAQRTIGWIQVTRKDNPKAEVVQDRKSVV